LRYDGKGSTYGTNILIEPTGSKKNNTKYFLNHNIYNTSDFDSIMSDFELENDAFAKIGTLGQST